MVPKLSLVYLIFTVKSTAFVKCIHSFTQSANTQYVKEVVQVYRNAHILTQILNKVKQGAKLPTTVKQVGHFPCMKSTQVQFSAFHMVLQPHQE